MSTLLSSVPSSDKGNGSSPSRPQSSATSIGPDGSQSLGPSTDPTVITGLAFRFPGAKSLPQLWDNVVTRKDLQQKIPKDRFNVDAFYHPLGTNKGTTNARYGYFLDEPLSQFDNEFFHISKQEAESMDPQQRLLLEVVYEALEDAGIPLESIKGSRTSVYVGSFTNDYNSMTTKDLVTYPKYTVTGTGNAVLSNRISYFYDLHGPSMTIDTACSSSLVCFHLGNRSVAEGESDIAIVAGSALHFDPNIYITMTDFGMLSTDGRCRTFDKNGSGYVRGEGVCALVLKRQSSAEAAGDPIKAIVRGTGSNHDGSKAGLTLPNGAAQARLIRQIYKDSYLEIADTDYVEAHGTGTKAGDPIEANAIGSVFASTRDTPLYVGSIKSNLGHLEGASGLAGVVKAVMSVSTGKILPNMHFETPNPDIDFKLLKIKVPTEVTDWPHDKPIRRASINSFGYGGSNSHAIIENYSSGRSMASILPTHDPASHLDEDAKVRPYLLPLSVHNKRAATKNVAHIREYLSSKSGSPISVPDIAFSYSFRRSRLQLRSFAIGSNMEALIHGLDNITTWNSPVGKSPRLGFIFTGQGAQWHAMGRELLQKLPLFRQTIERCDRILSELPDRPEWTCVAELTKSKEDTRLGESLISQPLCAALQLGIIEILRAWGIIPRAVVGHSSGEIVAAYAAGILSFRSTIICAYYRGLYMSYGTSERGAMLAVGMTQQEGLSALQPFKGRVALAAVNSPTSLTLSGDVDAVLELKSELDSRGVFNRRLRVEQAFHSHHMAPLAPGFEAALSRIPNFRPSDASLRMVSSVTARDSSARKMDASYWAANMTGVVRFADALTGMLIDENEEQDVDILVEIGAHPALKGPSRDVAKALGFSLPYVASLTRDAPAFESLIACAGELFSYGYNVDLEAVNSNFWLDSNTGDVAKHTPGKLLHDLPSYGWDHGSHWAETRPIRQHRLRNSRHTLLGAVVPGSQNQRPIWRNYLRLSEIPWLNGHCIQGKVIFPAAGYISMALEAVSTITDSTTGFQIRDVVFKNALVLTSNDAGTEVLLEIQPLTVSAKSTSSTWYLFCVSSYGDGDRLVEHCRGQIRAGLGSESRTRVLSRDERAKINNATDRRKPASLYYKQLQSIGLQYGDDFRLLKGDIDSGPGVSVGTLEFDPSPLVASAADRCIVHPAFLDSAFHVLFASIESCLGQPLNESFVPTFIRNAVFSGDLVQVKESDHGQTFLVDCTTDMPGTRVAHSNLRVVSNNATSEAYNVLVSIDGLEVTALGSDSADAGQKRELFFNISWKPLFSQFGTNQPLIQEYDLAHIVELKNLGISWGSSSEKRKFNNLNIWSESQTSDAASVAESRGAEHHGLIKHVKPDTESYDLIIVDEHSSLSHENFLKPNGYLISDKSFSAPGSLTKAFSNDTITAWQASDLAQEVDSQVPISVLISPEASELAKGVISSLKRLHSGKFEILTFGKEQPTSSNVVSLVNLDVDVLFEPQQEEGHLQSIKTLIKGVATNIVWATYGATIESSKPSQAITTGLLRNIRSEHDDIRIATVDFEDPQNGAEANVAHRILQTLFKFKNEEELAERGGRLYIPRVQSDEAKDSKLLFGGNRKVKLANFNQKDRNLSLKIGKTGLLDTLAFDDDEDTANLSLPDDHIEVKVEASALNFRDVAASIGIIDDNRLGDEAAGVVVRTGKSVSKNDFKPGDRVIAFRPGQGAHRTLIRNPAILCQKIGEMDFTTAAAFPLVLVTAYYSLHTVGRLQAGEYCLVHAAAGGVGQMAVQLALRAGAKVIATVGSPEKRQFLKDRFGLSDDVIFSSRDDSFVEGVMAVTNGRGCDVVLNSLAGELLQATWKSLAPLGRLIEIGKRDIHENSKLDMDPFRRNISYASVDAITLFHVAPELLSQQLRTAFTLIERGEIQPPGPIQVFTYGQAQKAFRTLQMGKFFGKIILKPDERELVPLVPMSFTDKPLFKPGKTYLLVGGLGGIGRSLSEWMFRRGARKLAFLSRSGDKSNEAKATIAWLHDRGVETSVFKIDATRQEDTHFGGVFQAAMVLRDGPFDQMTAAMWRECVHPKTRGTQNLHLATQNLDLDFFVCFSSISSVIGSVGQANYAAANSYLDALMAHRRAKGLAGATMNVGVVGDVGAVAEDSSLAVVLERLGYGSISQNELFYQIEEAILTSKQPASKFGVGAHQIISGINTKRKDVYWATKSLFRNLYANLDFSSAGDGQSSKTLLATLKSTASLDERIELLTAAFINKVAAVMGTPAESIQQAQPLTAYGLDSIVAIEFRKWFLTEASLDVPLFDILGAKSIKSLTSKAAESLRVEQEAKGLIGESGQRNDSQEPSKTKKSKTPQFEIKPNDSREHVPLSTYQSRLWFLHNIAIDPSTLNFAARFIIDGLPQLAVLQNTLEQMAKINGTLRTIYFEGEDFTEQSLASEFKSQIEFEDLSSARDIDTALSEASHSLRSRPIDIEVGESMKVRLFKLSETRHALVFSIHHINLDNGSTKTFLDHFTTLYDSLARKEEVSKVPVQRISYSDFAVWHNKFLDSGKVRDDLLWWQKSLSGLPEATALLPFASRSRPEVRSSNRSTIAAVVSSTILKRIKRIAATSAATPFHFLIAAFRAFIFRYTEEEDLTFLMVDGTRPHAEVSDMMGFFVNLIPLRLQLDADSALDSVLSHVSEASNESLAHNSSPFETILDSLKINRSASYFPISQIIVNYQVYGKPPIVSTCDFDITDISFQDIPTPADFALEATEDPAIGLELKLQYDPELYNDNEMERFLENFTVFLSSSAKDHRQPISEISIHSKSLGNTIDCEQNLEIASLYPNATAIETSDGEIITYHDVVAKAKRLALELEASGCIGGTTVGVLFKPSIDMVIALVGAAFAGCGYLPLDPNFAPDRLRHMISDTNVSSVILDPEFSYLVDALAPGLIKIHLRDSEKNQPGYWQQKEAFPNDPFYVIYTSGSTGKPKGVVLTQSNVQAMLSGHNETHQLGPSDRLLFLTSYTWDVSVSQIWGSLTSGATMLLAKEELRQYPERLAKFLATSGVTITYTTPTQYAAMLLDGKQSLRSCKNYLTAIFAGEALPARLVREVYDLGCEGLKIYNEFGPTEATVQTTFYLCPYPSTDDAIPIGYGLPNCSHYVVDPNLHPVPATVLGELCEGGPQISSGYINRPDATSHAFVKNNLASDEILRLGWTTLYRTGDRARFLQDGQLEYRGRISGDHQIKLRGYRIELGEIENLIMEALQDFNLEVVADAAVVPRRVALPTEDPELVDDRQLIAFLATARRVSNRDEIVNAIHSSLVAKLNSYMLPNGYHVTDALPTLPSGKRDRRALTTMDLDLVFPTNNSNATQSNSIEINKGGKLLEAVIDIFRRVLKLKAEQVVNGSSSFFELGGHSMLVLRLVSQLKRGFSISLDVREVFSDLTPYGVARVVADKAGLQTPPAPVVTEASGIDWQKEALLPDESAYYPSLGDRVVTQSDRILLTGADSVVGCHLLVRLLNYHPNVRITVLGIESPLSLQLIEQTIQNDRLILVDTKSLHDRVDVSPGCLAEPNLGLGEEDFRTLSQSTTRIYHFGSQISLVKSFNDLKQANILATRDLIRLAAMNPTCSIHYLSSWSVAHLQRWKTTKYLDVGSSDEIFKDERVPDHFFPTGSDFAYFKTRWAAEMLLSQASERGIPTNIYRTSGLDHESTNSEGNFFLKLVQSMVDTRAIADFGHGEGISIDFVTPDYVATSVLHLAKFAKIDKGPSQVFHIRNPSAVSLRQLPDVLRQYNSSIGEFKFVSIEKWLELASENDELNSRVTQAYLDLGHEMFSLDDSKTRKLLETSPELRSIQAAPLPRILVDVVASD
uniref:Carrier domain-containing protein n=1 Tax=Bionectria ochroleuca TaxID=29856 RepID=A0A8H7N118_BIOOC